MKAATVNTIKDELSHLPAKQLVNICIRLARFKKENKELLTYILFEEDNIPGYVEQVKKEIDDLFSFMNTSNLYFSKKTIRKAGRVTTKYIRYSLSKIVETELLLYYAWKIKESGIPFKKSSARNN